MVFLYILNVVKCRKYGFYCDKFVFLCRKYEEYPKMDFNVVNMDFILSLRLQNKILFLL
jgi:hypothetical protein